MRIKSLYIILSINILFSVSCKKQEEIIFPKTDYLSGNIIFKNDINLLNTMEIRLINNLIVFEQHKGSPRFIVYDKNTHIFQGSYGYIGKGPHEFLAPGQQLTSINKKSMAWIIDFYKNDLSLLDISKSINTKNNTIIKSLNFPNKLRNLKQSVITKDSLLISGISDVSLFGRFVSYNLTSNNFNFFGELPKKNRDSRLKEKLYGFISSISPDQSKFVVAMHYFNRLEIYDSKAKLTKVIGESLNKTNKISDRDISNGKLIDQYSGIYSTNSYIFALKLDVLEEAEAKDKEIYVEVFDWDGNPVHKFILSDYAQGVAYDEDDKILYTVNYWTHGNITKYDLSSFL